MVRMVRLRCNNLATQTLGDRKLVDVSDTDLRAALQLSDKSCTLGYAKACDASQKLKGIVASRLAH